MKTPYFTDGKIAPRRIIGIGEKYHTGTRGDSRKHAVNLRKIILLWNDHGSCAI